MNIVASAFPFGYGPASKMLVIAKQLHSSTAQHNVDFVGSDIALMFAEQNAQYYANTYPFDNIDNLDALKYDLAICVMNHYFTIWAYLHGIPTIFIDSLFWFWEWDNKSRLSIADDFIEEIRKGMTFSEAMIKAQDFNSHELKYVAYRLADTVMTQDFIENQNDNKHHMIRDSIARTRIGPIVDTSYNVSQKLNKNDVLISLSGAYSPLNREPQALAYAELVLIALDDFINSQPEGINIIMSVNPDMAKKISPRSKRVRLTSLSHDNFLQQLAKSKILFAPAGVTTIYESIYYNVPIIFLPEQHDGHYKNYLRLTNNGAFADIFPNLLFNTRLDRKESSDPDLEILNIQKLISDKPKDVAYIREIKQVLYDLATVIKSKQNLDTLANRQKSVFKEVSVPIFNINDYIVKG